MIISIIAAMAEGRVIGWKGKLPWHIPVDLARFKAITMGHTVVMGRRTYEAIGHPLSGRTTIVVSRSRANIEGCAVVGSLQEALDSAGGDDELFICGGAELYEEAFPFCQRIYLTLVHGRYLGDVLFPDIPDAFKEVHREELPDATPPLSFLICEKLEQMEPDSDVEQLLQKGCEALQRKLYFLARRCFEQALSIQETPEISSRLAYCVAVSGGDCRLALELAEKALDADPENLTCLFNLGRVQLLAGSKDAGLETLRRGVQAGGGKEFLNELATWSARPEPPVPVLERSHPLNRLLGLVMHRLGLRGRHHP